MISISLEKTSGVITLLTVMNDQLLAQQTNEKLIELVNERFTEIKDLKLYTKKVCRI